jgi:hypothetical protein
MNESRRTSPPDDDWNEPTDEHEEAAKAELADDPGALWDVYSASVWQREYADLLYAKSLSFNSEVQECYKDAQAAMEHSSWWKEHILRLFQVSEAFRNEVYRMNKEWIIGRAQELADIDARQQADEAAFERAEILREGDR